MRHALAALALIVLAVVPPVRAYVPAPERIQAAIARTNVASGRHRALRLELSLQIGERPAVATGELITHPTGLARLELRGAGDLIERHLLLGSELAVSRNGRIPEDHRAFLPPLFVLQADSEVTLRAALESFGVQVDIVGLAECGEGDCFVFGDPAREVPRPSPPELPGLEVYREPELLDGAQEGEAQADPLLAGEAPAETAVVESGPRARIWVDSQSYEVRGIDTSAGVQVRLGPIAVFEKLRVPAWISIEEPGKAPARFDVMRASQVSAPASVFSREWLLSPVTPQSSASPTEPRFP